MGYELRESDVYGLAQQVGAIVRRRGEELFFQLCPYCHGGESRDKDTFSVNLKSGAFSCFRSGCGKKGHFVELCRDFGYPLDFGEKQGKQYRKFPQKPVEVREPAVEYLKSRGIGEEVARKYHVGSELRESDG